MVDLAEYVLYRCIKEEGPMHKLKKITYSFEILDDCKACGGALANFVGQKIKRFSSRPPDSLTADRQSLERSTSFINRSFNSIAYAHVPEGDGNENGYDDGDDGDDKWLQPEYDKDNDVLQLMVSDPRYDKILYCFCCVGKA